MPTRISDQIVIEIAPIGIENLDQDDFLLTRPAFDLLLAGDGFEHGFIELVPDEQLALVFRGEPGRDRVPVLPRPLRKIRRHAGIERAVPFARHDENAAVSWTEIPGLLAR